MATVSKGSAVAIWAVICLILLIAGYATNQWYFVSAGGIDAYFGLYEVCTEGGGSKFCQDWVDACKNNDSFWACKDTRSDINACAAFGILGIFAYAIAIAATAVGKGTKVHRAGLFALATGLSMIATAIFDGECKSGNKDCRDDYGYSFGLYCAGWVLGGISIFLSFFLT
eukprot:TRINITY_DN758_c0_g1_i1.p1 TRINITY_DN758_c0_g1~~TRINITY_DN758_c0_g1_i1.p1  ORF type:complete len:170 (-),score=27.22 TRINITY_DN758_c0_g1_i1:32-541(-)